MIYSKLFQGREDAYAVSTEAHRWSPVRSAPTVAVFKSHLSGKRSIGLYFLRKDHKVRMAAVDIDRDDEPLATAITRRLIHKVPDTAVLMEQTGGRGWHIWVFFDDWVPAKSARSLLRSILSEVELPYPVEIYPKQDRLGKDGLGNLMRLPLGVHPSSGERSTIYTAFGLPIEVGNEANPDLPVEPAPSEAAQAQEGLEQENPDPVASHALPCIEKFKKGVKSGARDEAMFRLAAFLHRQQIPKDAAYVVLQQANQGNKPKMPDAVLVAKLESAFSGRGYGLPCSSDLVGLDSPFCDPSCPVYATAKKRRDGDIPDGGQPGGVYPRLMERGGQYVFLYRTKTGVAETMLSNFTMEVQSRLEVAGAESDVLRVKITGVDGRSDIMDIPVTAFSSRANLIRHLTRAEYAWYGDDRHCQYLKAHLSEGDFSTQKAVIKVGRVDTESGPMWMMPNGVISPNGTVADPEWTYHRPPHMGSVLVSIPNRAYTKAKAGEVLKGLMDANDESIMVPVLGWSFAVPHKPWFMSRMGHFPLLMLYGTRGAGKTQLIQRVVLPLFGYDPREPQIHFCDTTRFVLVSYGASTTTIPLFFDEYRPNALGSAKLRQLWDNWRHIYAEDTDHRGQADLTRLEFKQTSPIVVAGEEMVADPAMQERMVQVSLSPDTLTSMRRKKFQGLPPVHLASKEFIRQSLSTDPTKLYEKAVEMVSGPWEHRVSPRVYDNLLVVAFGLFAWADMTGGRVTARMKESIFDLSPMVLDEETDQVRTPLWVDEFLLDVVGMIREKGVTSWAEIVNESGTDILYFNLRKAHSEWSKELRSRGEQAVGAEPIRRQLAEHSVSRFVVGRNLQRRILGNNVRVYAVDLNTMQEILEGENNG